MQFARLVGPALFLLALMGCASSSPPPTPSSVGDMLQAQYQQAVEDAKTAEPSEIDSSLTRIVPTNDRLRWRTVVTPAGDSVRQVLVVTWTRAAPLLPSRSTPAGPGDTLRLATKTVWVTAVPEVWRFCQPLRLSDTERRLRLRQYIGLPPQFTYDRFVEMWVRPDDLVRPCPDPEITDATCRLGEPSADAPAAFRDWFAEWRSQAYEGNGTPYPWTRLGYTYDWNPDSDEVGVSEFLLFPPATLTVHRSVPTDRYCR